MKSCPACSQEVPDEAKFCLHCGQTLAISDPDPDPTPQPEEISQVQLWEAFVGPSKSLQFSMKEGWGWRPAFKYYQEKFAQIETPSGPRFVLSWNWPAALFDSFLWFLYRKMYLFALLYAVLPAMAIFLTGDMSVGLVSRMLAGGSANYLYYWHVRDKIQRIMALPAMDAQARTQLIREEGGVQPYVLWLGVALHLLMIGLLISAIQEGPPELPVPTDEGGTLRQKFL
ncbi:MAG: DUF2628 domain-containing protein [Nitrospirales bacterium]